MGALFVFKLKEIEEIGQDREEEWKVFTEKFNIFMKGLGIFEKSNEEIRGYLRYLKITQLFNMDCHVSRSVDTTTKFN